MAVSNQRYSIIVFIPEEVTSPVCTVHSATAFCQFIKKWSAACAGEVGGAEVCFIWNLGRRMDGFGSVTWWGFSPALNLDQELVDAGITKH